MDVIPGPGAGRHLHHLHRRHGSACAIHPHNHLRSNNFTFPFQSDYRSGHSTEIALLRVLNDLLIASDSCLTSALTILNLSAAFDTIDHSNSSLLHRLKNYFHISGSVLSWFQSYLSGRWQIISVNNTQSDPTFCPHGVPQGSVLGPIMFVMYVQPIYHILQTHEVDHQRFADIINSTDLPLLKSIKLSPHLKTVFLTSRTG